ncbi:TolC family protein [Pasteurella skyensis]|uniref:TolC family protein n=1 Tax=Phocoenobacter skyensis TaxID=97481 RepID=A0AAJ6NFY1_9PAST|nr:TolC family protein [Pasteurella skyensis]MDP8171727.1 TolC family protein [Pasteurella skyensis]MDP8175911.1 TolC family protein [Pasteurella skyensis]
MKTTKKISRYHLLIRLLSYGLCVFMLASCSLPKKQGGFTVRKLSFASSTTASVKKTHTQPPKQLTVKSQPQVANNKKEVKKLLSTMKAITKIKPVAPIASQNALQRIIHSALQYNMAHSPLPAVIEQREFETEAIRNRNLPDIRPTASVSGNGYKFAGISGSYTLYDFGLNNALEQQGELKTLSSRLNFLQEQRNTIADTLISVSKIAALQAKQRLIHRSIKQQQQLAHYASNRLNAGLITESEPLALDLRLSELNTKLDATKVEIQLNLKLLSSKLSDPITLNAIPAIDKLAKMVGVFSTVGKPIALKQAELAVQTAKQQLLKAKAERYPKIAVEGRAGYNSDNEEVYQANLTLSAPTSIFASNTNVSVAEANYRSKRKRLSQTRLNLATERERIQLETKRLKQNQLQLRQLENASQRSLMLYRQKIGVAKASISDMISAYRTLLNAQEQLVNVDKELMVLKAKLIKITAGNQQVK